jgi:hypothetical protein
VLARPWKSGPLRAASRGEKIRALAPGGFPIRRPISLRVMVFREILVKGVTRYIFRYRDEGKREIFVAIVSHFDYAICYNRNIELII